MRVITPAQSRRIGAEIYAQGCRLDDAADQYRSPWGDLIADRLRRLSDERFAVVCCKRNP
jgi:hypothetical protein